jgi:hypothetical protein
MYQLRLQLEEYEPKIVYIKGIHNTLADVISLLEYDPSVNPTAESYFMTTVNENSKCNQRQNWMAVSEHWYKLKVDTNMKIQILCLQISKRRTKYTLLLQ